MHPVLQESGFAILEALVPRVISGYLFVVLAVAVMPFTVAAFRIVRGLIARRVPTRRLAGATDDPELDEAGAARSRPHAGRRLRAVARPRRRSSGGAQ